jgi:hypothetical protein
MGTVDVCIGNNLIIDFDIYHLWVNGYSVDECKEHILRKDSYARSTKEHIVVKDIADNYYVFNKLEHYLYAPPRLKEQLLFQLTDEIANKLIERLVYIENYKNCLNKFLCCKRNEPPLLVKVC